MIRDDRTVIVTLELDTRQTLGMLGNRGWWAKLIEPLGTVKQATAQVAQPSPRGTARRAHGARR